MLKKIGLECVIDISCCDDKDIHNIKYLQTIMHQIAKMMNTNIVGEIHHTFTPHGITVIAIVADSHIAIHTWPEYAHICIDIFSCKRNIPISIINYLKDVLKSKEIRTHKIDRITRIKEN